MSRDNFGSEIYQSLAKWAGDHRFIEIRAASGGGELWPNLSNQAVFVSGDLGVDMILFNKKSNRGLGIEVKSAKSDLPVSVLPGLKRTKKLLGDINCDFVVLTSSSPSEILRDTVGASGIDVLTLSKASDVVTTIRSKLAELAPTTSE